AAPPPPPPPPAAPPPPAPPPARPVAAGPREDFGDPEDEMFTDDMYPDGTPADRGVPPDPDRDGRLG
ncbi:hypothetical protein ABQE60_04365, partial [Mycolicibacillus trivialis]